MEVVARQSGVSAHEVLADLETVGDVLPKVSAWLKASILGKLRQGLSSFQPTEAALEKWPCFKDPSKLLENYGQCIVADAKGNVVLAPEALAARGLPHNLAVLLEYGDPGGVPALPHWRPALEEAARTDFGGLLAKATHGRG